MKAIVYSEYGSAEVLRLEEVSKPAPRDDEVPVKVHASSVNGFHSIFAYRRALSPRGRYAMIVGGAGQLFQALLLGPWLTLAGGRKMLAVSSKPNQQDLLFLKEIIESGKIKSLIDRRYPLGDVPDAIRYVETGHARGKVVITMGQNN